MKSTSPLLIAAFLAVGDAHATDIYPPDAGPAMYSPASAFDWSGFYLGGVAGGGLFGSESSDIWCIFACDAPDMSDWGFTAGATVGANWQFGAGVLGLEADFSWADLKNELSISGADYTVLHGAQWDWFGTIRARAGLALDRAFIYGTGGIAFVGAQYSAEYTDGCNFAFLSDCRVASDATEIALAVGGGAEYAFNDRASLKLDYLFVGLPDSSDVVESDVGGCAPGECIVNWKSDAQLVRLGLNWRF